MSVVDALVFFTPKCMCLFPISLVLYGNSGVFLRRNDLAAATNRAILLSAANCVITVMLFTMCLPTWLPGRALIGHHEGV